ncbi:general substrate transporter [Aspergillus fruticulosus]
MSAYSQFPQDLDADTLSGTPPTTTSSQQLLIQHDSLRIYYVAAVACTGGLLFGYDSGVIGGVLTFPSFAHSFYPDTSTSTSQSETNINALAVATQQAGALLGCLLIWPVTNTLGRRKALTLCSIIFCIGVLFEILTSHSLPLFYAGRIIAGLGVGGSATVAPIYLAEMSPPHLRGRLGSGYQFTFTIGIFASYWIDYAFQMLVNDESAAQWRIPLALQLAPGVLMGAGMLSLPESVRWLLGRGYAHTHEAWKSLIWVRGGDEGGGVRVGNEFAEMKRAVHRDTQESVDFHPRELLLRPNRHRIFLAVSLFIAQQATGATAMAYFGPQFFSILVNAQPSATEASTNSLTLLLTGIFGALKVLSCLLFILFIADRFGRRPLLILGALGMAVCMIATSVLVHSMPTQGQNPSTTTVTSLSPRSLLTILLIYLFIAIYNTSWGPLPWPLVAELFPTRTRSSGVALAVASQWASNFVWSFATPYLLRDVGANTFLLFGGVCVGVAGFVALCVPETRGLSLEEVQGLFGGVDGGDDGDGNDEEWEGLVGGSGSGSGTGYHGEGSVDVNEEDRK